MLVHGEGVEGLLPKFPGLKAVATWISSGHHADRLILLSQPRLRHNYSPERLGDERPYNYVQNLSRIRSTAPFGARSR
jgi:hypothetical protein